MACYFPRTRKNQLPIHKGKLLLEQTGNKQLPGWPPGMRVLLPAGAGPCPTPVGGNGARGNC